MGYILVYLSIFYLANGNILEAILYLWAYGIFIRIWDHILILLDLRVNLSAAVIFNSLSERRNVKTGTMIHFQGADIRNGDFGKFYNFWCTCVRTGYNTIWHIFIDIHQGIHHYWDHYLSFIHFGITSIAILGAEFTALSYN
jgi:hypothetical protein